MITVFIEYQIEPDQRTAFLRQQTIWKNQLQELGGQNFRFYEGVDQPDLFVEEFEVAAMDDYAICKAQRIAKEEFTQCVKGGAAKVHIWAFRQVADYHKE